VRTVKELLRRFWRDDAGAVVSTEYLMLGSVVVLGGVGGMATLRDATVNEMAEFGKSVRSVRQSYSVAPQQSPVTAKDGTKADEDQSALDEFVNHNP
jgi:hypothetical protein